MRNVGKWTAVVVTGVVALIVGLGLGAAAGTEKTVTAAVPTATETVTVTETQGSAEPVTETVEQYAPPVAAAGKKAPPPVTRARKVSAMVGSQVALVYVAAHAKGAATREIITVYRGSRVVARVATHR